jgi:hypothetical protein
VEVERVLPQVVVHMVDALALGRQLSGEGRHRVAVRDDGDRAATRLQVQIDTLKMKVTNTERNQDGMLEIMEALLRIRCTELSDREIRRLGVPCKMADK